MSNTPSPAVEVTQADRDAATALGQLLGVPDITGPRNQDAIAKAFARHRLTPLPTRDAAIEEAASERYLSSSFEWAAPGDQQEDAWLLRFCDKDCREAIFTGPDAEREAWEHWNRYAPAFNIYLFRLARLSTPTSGEASAPPPLSEGEPR